VALAMGQGSVAAGPVTGHRRVTALPAPLGEVPTSVGQVHSPWRAPMAAKAALFAFGASRACLDPTLSVGEPNQLRLRLGDKPLIPRLGSPVMVRVSCCESRPAVSRPPFVLGCWDRRGHGEFRNAVTTRFGICMQTGVSCPAGATQLSSSALIHEVTSPPGLRGPA